MTPMPTSERHGKRIPGTTQHPTVHRLSQATEPDRDVRLRQIDPAARPEPNLRPLLWHWPVFSRLREENRLVARANRVVARARR